MRLHVTLVIFKLARFSSVFFFSLLIRPARPLECARCVLL
jgi:hypothetical protein